MQSALRTILTFAAAAFVSLFPARAADESGSAQPRSFVAEQQGSCPNGFYYRDLSDFKKAPQNQEIWGSYCGDRDKDQNTGYLRTTPFSAPSTLQLYLAGYPSRPGLVLKLERLTDGSTLPIEISTIPHESWRLYQFSLPASWQGKPIRLVAEDRATNSGGWFAFTRPEPAVAKAQSTQAMSVLKPLVLSFLLTALFFYAGCSTAAKLGHPSVVLMGLSGLAAVGLDGYLSFWLWFFSPAAGRWSNLLLPLAAAVYVMSCLRTLDKEARQGLKEFLLPLGLVGLTSLLVASTGFLYGGLENPFETASTRFSHALPPDNTIPFLFAEGLVNGHVKRPLLADWLSSDRPPLQTGIYLSQRRYFVHELPYTVVSIVAQSLWIMALWLLLTAFRINGRAVNLILLLCLFNGFIFLNTFYTWPKLLAASYVVGFAALLLPHAPNLRSHDGWFVPGLAGAMVALGMLSHGGSMFGIAGVVFAYLFVRRSPIFKPFLLILGSAFLLYLPWILYQRLYEPPGDRLLKYHLAGVEPLDPRTFGQVAAEAYGKLTFHDWSSGRMDNLLTIVDHPDQYWRNVITLLYEAVHSGSHWTTAVASTAAELRAMNFFYLFPCMGPLLLALFAIPVAFVRKLNSTAWTVAVTLWLFVVGTSVIWCLLMFKPGSTVLHQGTYALVLLFVAAAVLTLWAVSPAIAIGVGSVSAAFHVLLYIPLMRQSSVGDVLRDNSLDYGFLSLAMVSLISIALILWRLSQRGLGDAHDNAVDWDPSETIARQRI